MNCKIPFTKDIAFEKKLYEITSISLEHELNVQDNTLKGNFIVSGDFRSHEVSVNKEAFSYILPFEIDIAEDIDKDTIEFMIDDFTYEVIDSAILRVNIDFNVIASLKEIEEEEVFQDVRDIFLEDEEEDTLMVNEEIEEKETPEKEEEKKVEVVIELPKEVEEIEVVKEERNEEMNIIDEAQAEDTIIDSIKGVDEEYTTYHIHMVSDGETVETICTMYNSNINILSEYNDLSELSSGDKLIIPKNNE